MDFKSRQPTIGIGSGELSAIRANSDFEGAKVSTGTWSAVWHFLPGGQKA